MNTILKSMLLLLVALLWISNSQAQSFSALDRLCQDKKKGRNDPNTDEIADCSGDPCADNSLSTAVIVINCNEGSNGEIDLTVTGMTTPITYTWSNGVNTEDQTGLSAGEYSVVVVDADGCEEKTTIILTEPDPLDMRFSFSNEACPGTGNGNAAVFVNGGTSPYSYAWSNGLSGNITGAVLAAGNYTCTVTDNLGCTISKQVTIGSNDCGGGAPSLTADAGADETICLGNTVLLGATQTAQGGNSPYTFNWSGPFTISTNSDANPTVSGLTAGNWTYSVTVTDASAATAVSSVQITVATLPSVTLMASSTSVCSNSASVSLTGAPSGGTYSGAGVSGASFDPSVAGAGEHSLYYHYTDGNDCEGTASVNITVSPQASASWILPMDPISVCDPAFDLNQLVTGTAGGTWSGSVVTNEGVLDPSFGPGTFAITYQVGTGPCQVSQLLNVDIVANPVASFTPLPLSPCDPAFGLAAWLDPLATTGGQFIGGPYIDPMGQMDPGQMLPGQYPVTYMVGEGACQVQQTTLITINAPTVAAAFSVQQSTNLIELTNTSTNATSWSWDFGDGKTSTEQNPIHSYASEGIYWLCLTASSSCGNDISCQSVSVVKPADFISLDLTAKLGGCTDPSNSFLMNDDLRQMSLLPLEEPYTGLGYAHKLGGGLEQMDPALLLVTGNTAPVDWVVIELRFKGDPVFKMASITGLILRNGQIVDAQGNALQIQGLPADDYFVVIKHRNHLGVMTDQPIPLSQTPTAIDFSQSSTNTFGNHAQYEISPGITCLWPGDANTDGQIIYSGAGTDINTISTQVLLNPLNPGFSPTLPLQEYGSADLNMDGQVIYSGSGTDVNINSTSVLLNPLNTGFSPTLPLMDQVPVEQ